MADSQKIAFEFTKKGFLVNSNDYDPDIYIINSCTVTSRADRKARQAANAAKKRWPKSKIIMTGCYAERDEENLNKISSIDLVIGGKRKSEIVTKVIDYIQYDTNSNNKNNYKENSDLFLLGRTRASIKIQEGCDQICSYCIVPRVRGREKSIDHNEIINSINTLVQKGVSEVVLTGTQLGTYGFEFKNINLSILIKKILDETNISRLRVSSIQPQEIDEDLLSNWRYDTRLCPHFHVPLQSGSEKILKSMRRKYDLKMYENSINQIRSILPDCSVTTDIIAGYPGETEDDHESSKEFLDSLFLADTHVFKYSDRPGTTSMYLKDKVPSKIINSRAYELREISRLNKINHLNSMIGQIREVLWEDSIRYSGLTDNYIRVKLSGKVTPKRKIIENTINSVYLSEVINDEILVDLV